MKNAGIGLGLLVAVLALGLGASTEGIQQARDWQYYGDVARQGRMWDAAYTFYAKIAKTYPDTRHGRVAAKRARQMRAQMVEPSRPAGSADLLSWAEEVFDFLVFP